MLTSDKTMIMNRVFNQKGLTLVELLVAMALSSFLLMAVIQIISLNSRSVSLSQAFVQVQESARLSSEILSQELKLAGNRGCLNSNDPTRFENEINTAAGSGYDAFFHNYDGQKIDGINDFDGTYNTAAERFRTPASNDYGGVTPLTDTDVFISRGATTTSISVAAAAAVADTTLSVSGDPSDLAELVNGRPFMVTNCVRGEIYVVSGTVLANPPVNPSTLVFNDTAIAGSPENLPGGTGLIRSYPVGSEVIIFNTSAYFIAPSQVLTDDVDGDGFADVSSLYKYSELHGVAQELVPYVSDMQITYGVNTTLAVDNIINDYLDADDAAITSAEQIYSVRIELTITSQDLDVADGDPVERIYTRVIHLRNTKIGA